MIHGGEIVESHGDAKERTILEQDVTEMSGKPTRPRLAAAAGPRWQHKRSGIRRAGTAIERGRGQFNHHSEGSDE
jgi:hypothetical protein